MNTRQNIEIETRCKGESAVRRRRQTAVNVQSVTVCEGKVVPRRRQTASERGVMTMTSRIRTVRLGAAIRILRLEKDLTCTGLVSLAGISAGELAAIESGDFDYKKHGKSIQALCKALGKTEDELIAFSEELMPSDPAKARERLDSLFKK